MRRGEKIAERNGEFFVALHASVSGKVSAVGDVIEILSDGKDEAVPEVGRERPGWESLPSDEILRILQESGIEIPRQCLIDTLILNGCESEPYLTSAYCLLMSHPVEILKAGEILRRAFKARELILAVEDHNEEVAEVLRSKIFFHTWSHACVEMFPYRYPQEDERILIRELTEPGAKCLVQDVATAYAVYEAVVLQKPFYERVVTIAGECVAQPRNFWLRIGTLVEEAVKCARGFLREPERVVLGGPMKGLAIDTLNVPVLKQTRGILGLPQEVAKPVSIEPCIRCGLCVENCPVSISPAMVTLASEKGFFDIAQNYGASLCIECGNCSYVCPAKRPMVELIRHANVNAH